MTRPGRSCKKIEKEDPRIHFREIVNQVEYTKAQYQLGDGRAVGRRDPRRARGVPVPARYPRDR